MADLTKQKRRVLNYLRRIDNLADKAVELSEQKIQARTEHAETLAQQTATLQANLDALDADFAPFEFLTCRKTGQVIGQNTAFTVSRTVQLLGRARAKELLQLQGMQHCAPHWISTAGADLTALAKHDPVGYFVYAACKCAKLDGPYNDASNSQLRMMHAANIEQQATAAAHLGVKYNLDWREQFQAADEDKDKAAPFKGAPSRNFTTAERWQHHTTRRRMFTALSEQRVALELIIAANEYMRRVLAMAHPRELPNGKWAEAAINACFSDDAARQWIDLLKAFLAKQVRGALIRNFAKAKEPFTRIRRVANTYMELRYNLGGLRAFAKQQNLHGATGIDAALADLDELDIFSGETEEWRIRLKAKGRSDTKEKARAAEDAQKYAGAVRQSETLPQIAHKQVEKPAPFRLKLPGAATQTTFAAAPKPFRLKIPNKPE